MGWACTFPQSHDCGLIEVMSGARTPAAGSSFPQSHDCGLIEVSVTRNQTFGGANFPQSHDCGLIEVAIAVFGTGRRTITFPQSHDCGLIEVVSSTPFTITSWRLSAVSRLRPN